MPTKTKNVEERQLTDAEENVAGPSTSAGEMMSVDGSSIDMTTAQGQDIKLDDALLEGIKKGEKDAIHKFLAISLRLIAGKESLSEQIDSVMNEILAEKSSTHNNYNNYQVKLQMLLKNEEKWKSKYWSAVRTVKELKNVIKAQQVNLRQNPYAKPIVNKRTVALQVNIKPKKDDKQLKIKIPLKSTTVNSATSRDSIIEEPVIICDDDDNEGIVKDLEKSIPSTSSLKIIRNNSPNKISQLPIINKPSLALLPKKVPPSAPVRIVGSIDLTEDDDKVNLTSPTINNNEQLTQQVNNFPSTLIPAQNIAIAQPTYTGFIMRRPSLNSATPTTGLTQLLFNSSVTSNSINLQTSGRHFLYRNGQLLPCHISSVRMNSLQIQSNNIQPRIISSGIFPQPVPPSTSLPPVPHAIPLFPQHPAPPPTTYSQPRNLDFNFEQ